MKNLEFKEMTANEIKEGLQLLNLAIKQHKIGYKNANPIKQNCYISSNDVEGVYFPNSELLILANGLHITPNHDIIALVKKGESLGLCYTYKTAYLEQLTAEATQEGKQHIFERLGGYFFASLESIVYTYEEQRAIDNLKINMSYAEKELQVLNHIKIITKKDGTPFADICKNIDPQPNPNINISVTRSGEHSLRIFESVSKVSACGNPYNEYNETHLYKIDSASDIAIERDGLIAKDKEYISKLKSDLKNIKKLSAAIEQFNKAISIFSATTQSFIKRELN